jgi:outer membrane protein assembly factor BamB
MARLSHPLVVAIALIVVASGTLLLPSTPERGIPTAAAPAGAAPLVNPAASLGPDYWPMYLYNAEHISTNPNDTIISAANASSLGLTWKTQLTNVPPIGSVIAASPEVVGDTVYLGAWDGNFSAINATTGQVLWHDYLGQTNVTNCNSPRGVTSSAAIYNGSVYVGGGDDYFYALNASTGAVEWKILVGDNSNSGGLYNWASPVIYGGYEYIGVASDCDEPLVRGELIQVSLATHLAVNEFYTVPSGKLGGTIWTTPTFDPSLGLIILATGNCKGNNYNESPYCGAIVALKMSNISQVAGYWQDAGCGGQASNDDCDLPTSPAVFVTSHGTPMVEAGDKSGNMYALDLSTPSLWSSKGPNWTTRIAVGGNGNIEKGGGLAATAVWTGTYLVDAGQEHKNSSKTYWGSIAALDPDNGNIVWQTFLPYSQSTFGAVTYENGAIIEGGADVTSSTANYLNGTLFILNATNGKILWQYGTPGLFYGPATVALGHIFIGNFLGTLYCFGLPTKLEVSSFTATPSTIYLGQSSELATGISGESGAVTYAYSGLPTGCASVNSSSLSCTPSKTGQFEITVTVTDTDGGIARAETNLTVGEPYTVTFSETGLPSGTMWSVALNFTLLSSSTSSIVFTTVNGTYNFTVENLTGFAASPANGTVDVTGAPVSESIVWTAAVPQQYAVTFTESGLPSGTSWSVTLNGSENSSTSVTIGFVLPNGTFSFTIAPIAGYTTPTYSGSVTVQGQAVGESIPWSLSSNVTYTVTFNEAGLPTGTSWTVTLAGTLHSSTGSSVLFSVPNGTFAYVVGSVSGYTASPPAGNVTVAGSGLSVALTFGLSPGHYSLTVQENGLPSGTSWSVTINSTVHTSATSAIVVGLANGTYSVSVLAIAGYEASPVQFAVTIAGADVTKLVTWQPVEYSVTFSETGLSAGTTWSVTLNGSFLSSTTSQVVFTEPNGSYAFTVGSVTGYSASLTSGNLAVSGKNATEAITFSSTSNGGSSPSSSISTADLVVIAGVVLLAIAVLLVILLRRRRPPPAPATEPASPNSPSGNPPA